MAFVTEKDQTLEIINSVRKSKTSMAIFCTASHWNAEAILLAAQRFAEKNNISKIPISVAMTVNYEYLSQASRVTYNKDFKAGFLSIMEHIKALCAYKDSPYYNVIVLPHLDHADPGRDRWALDYAPSHLASVMFDAQKYSKEDNIRMTKEYVKKNGDTILIEGIMEELSVEGLHHSKTNDKYVERAIKYCKQTGVDFLVADLGTEQQSSGIGKCEYLGHRARELTKNLGKSMLVLHGTSCLNINQMTTLAEDGVVRVNMWTRIAREAGQYAANKLIDRAKKISNGDFEAIESKQYLYDSIEKASDIMEETLEVLGYGNLGDKLENYLI